MNRRPRLLPSTHETLRMFERVFHFASNFTSRAFNLFLLHAHFDISWEINNFPHTPNVESEDNIYVFSLKWIYSYTFRYGNTACIILLFHGNLKFPLSPLL